MWWKMYSRLHVNHSLLLSDFNETSIFSTTFRKNTQISNCMKIRPVGGELYHADRRTNGQEGRHDEADSGFSQFWERAKKYNKRTVPKIQFSSSSFRWALSTTSTYPPQHPTLRHNQRSSMWMTAQSFAAQQKQKQQLLIFAFFYGQAKHCELSFSKHSPN